MSDRPGKPGLRPTPASAGSRSRKRRLLVVTLLLTDLVAVALAGLTAATIWFGSVLTTAAFEDAQATFSFLLLSLLTAPLWVAIMAWSGLYDLDRVTWSAADAGRVARALSLGVVSLTLATFVLKAPGLSRGWVLLTWVLGIGFVLASRALVSIGLALARRRGWMRHPTLVVGSNAEALDIIRILRGSVEAGLVPVGCVTSSHAEKLELDYCSDDLPVLGSAREITAVLDEYEVDAVVIASSAFEHDVLARMIAELRDRDVDVHISSGLFEVLTSRVRVNEVAGVPLITVKGVSLTPRKMLTKRVFDLVTAGLVIVVGLPVWAAVAAAIAATSRGPIFYGQERVGRGGERFTMLKFRSMYQDADARLTELHASNEASGPLFKMKEDPRVTPVGRWMRKFSIDEFPQVINVMRGEMSLVGPRPPLPNEVDRYSRNDWRRLEVTPGMTGLWQVSGRSSLTFDEMVRLDLFYIENWSVSLDMTIIVRTVPAVLLARGAY